MRRPSNPRAETSRVRQTLAKAALAASVCWGAVLVAVPAHAACCVAYDYQDASNNKNQVISQLTDRINAMQLAIIEAMRLGTGQLSGNLKETIGAGSNTANVQDDRAVTGRVETARLTAIASSASGASSCNVITGANAGANLGSAVKSFTMANTHDMAKWDAGSDPAMPSSKGQGAAIEARLSQHCSLYATSADSTSGLCSGSSGGGTLELADQDVSQSLFYSPTNSDSETLDDQHKAAANEFMLNATDPAPPGPLLPSEAKQPGARKMEAQRHSAAARISVAANTFSQSIAFRAPLSSSDAAAWVKAMGSQTNTGAMPTGSNVSQYDWMQARARGWFLNPNWAVAADTQNEAQAIKDMAMMMSFQVYMQWEQFKLQEKNNLLLATLVSITNEHQRGMTETAH